MKQVNSTISRANLGNREVVRLGLRVREDSAPHRWLVESDAAHRERLEREAAVSIPALKLVRAHA